MGGGGWEGCVSCQGNGGPASQRAMPLSFWCFCLLRGRVALKRSDELIAFPWNGTDIHRPHCIVAQRGTNLGHTKIQPALEIDEGAFTSVVALYGLARDD